MKSAIESNKFDAFLLVLQINEEIAIIVYF